MNQLNDQSENVPDVPGPTAPTWAERVDELRKALSEPPREYRTVKTCRHGQVVCGCIGQPVQLPRTPQPASFLRWCGQPAVHSSHGRCDGVE